jgi:glycosyltransferase involved in cell wall biosynthesis
VRRLRVGIELRSAARPTAGGIVAVVVGTLHALFARRPDADFVAFCTVFNRELMTVAAPNVESVTLPLDDYFPELARTAQDSQIDVLFRGYPSVEAVDFPLDRQIFLIPDLQHEYYPQFFDSYSRVSRRLAFRTALEGAGAVMTISDFARRTIEDRVGADRDVFVARPSLPPEFVEARSEDATAEERETVPAAPFFFFPANLWPHKNHERLFAAVRRFRDRTGSNAELVLTGSPTGWAELRARHPDIPVRHLGYVRAPHLRLLYERALALTFFSQFEGFGIPLLEAFATDTPVLCSDTTSLPEVAGDAALTCDPEDVGAMSGLLERIAADPQLRLDLVARGRRRLEGFTWGNAAEQLDGAIERVHVRASSIHRQPRMRSGWNRVALRRELAWRLLRTPRLLTLVLRGRAALRALGRGDVNLGTQRSSGLRVRGFWPDNYIGELLEVVIDARDRPRELTISGRALVETSLVVSANGTRLGQFDLMPGERTSPRVEVPPGPREVVSFSFARHSVDAEGRSLAFLLEETNAFREEDLYTLG